MQGQPHSGKVLAVVVDKMPHFCTGTCAKLINEGYTGYLVRTGSGERSGDGTNGENLFNNEQENFKIAKELGFTDVIELYYRQHRMSGLSPIDYRARLIFIFRFFNVDTVITYNPWGLGDDNSDHMVTGQAVAEACWMAGDKNHLSEHMEAGVTKPYTVKERYYIMAQNGQPFNRVVDISSTKDKKINVMVEDKTGIGRLGSQMRKQLAKEGKRLPILGNNDETADREYVKQFLMDTYSSFKGIEQYGTEFAERFYYIDQRKPEGESEIEEYIKKHAVNI
ncbi:PIG-L deacetylase family protein, partial [Candidatus Latescibacterota bacterium]